MKKREFTPLQELNLLDRFLFSEAMDDPQFTEDVLSIIMGDDINILGLPQTEKEMRNQILRKYVKLDVWAIDDEEAIYDVEVQKKDTKNLPKRSRYYQAITDSKLLLEGETDYETLNRVYIIIISPFDLFGRERYKYTFQMRCDEETELKLNDEGYRLFLNTHGKDEENISPELKELLNFFEHTSDEFAEKSNSQRIKRMQKRVKSIKENEEVGARYMREWEERALERAEERAEGRAEGQEYVAKNMIQEGFSDEMIAKLTGLTLDTIAKLHAVTNTNN